MPAEWQVGQGGSLSEKLYQEVPPVPAESPETDAFLSGPRNPSQTQLG